jgi:hypothetical protein
MSAFGGKADIVGFRNFAKISRGREPELEVRQQAALLERLIKQQQSIIDRLQLALAPRARPRKRAVSFKKIIILAKALSNSRGKAILGVRVGVEPNASPLAFRSPQVAPIAAPDGMVTIRADCRDG